MASEFLTAEEAVDYLCLSLSTVNNLVQGIKLPGIKASKRIGKSTMGNERKPVNKNTIILFQDNI